MPSEKPDLESNSENSNREEPALHHAILSSQKSGYFRSKSYTFNLCQEQILLAQCTTLLQFGTFELFAKENDQKYEILNESLQVISSKLCIPDRNRTSQMNLNWKRVGTLNSPGIFWDRTIVSDSNNAIHAAILYSNTSRTGELMNMKVILPNVRKGNERSIIEMLCTKTLISSDIASMIMSFTGPIIWSEKVCDLDELISEANKNRILMKNRLPTWNSQISAYTLEFGGRALIPSVHNFQLIDCNKNVILQLGKISPTDFNLDFRYPLSPFQAFSICLSVIDRTFVWD